MKELHGWCAPEKESELRSIVRREHLGVCVEIGVFAGKSLIPVAEQLRENGAGIVHGIDPWATAAALEGDAGGAHHLDWWSKVDLEKVYQDFRTTVVERDLFKQVIVHRMTADEAAKRFPRESIDLLHIDGNHSEAASVRDVTTWLPLVRPYGWIVMDDTGPDWPTGRAVALLDNRCNLIRDWGTWRVYRKRG